MVQDHLHGLSVKGKCVHKHTHIHTPTPAHTHTRTHTLTQKTNPRYLQQTQIPNYFTMLPFLIQKMPILGVYIYFFQWFTADLF